MKRSRKGRKDFFSTKGKYKGQFFVTGYHKKTSLFTVGILQNNEIVELGGFSNGLSGEERNVLIELITKKSPSKGQHLKIEPGICVELGFTKIEKKKLEDAVFVRFRTDSHWSDATWANLLMQNSNLDSAISITHPDKPIWGDPLVVKDQFISYLHEVFPYMQPFLNNRILTVLRYPHGVYGEAFYQKNSPDYAPDFIQTHKEDDINYIVCNDLSTLFWLGNQLALEYHVPFNHIGNPNPYEIVFDLDPPSRDFFHLAVKAALEMKELFDKFSVKSYPKVSGNKGLQIHLPMKETPLTYDDARRFTSFIAEYIVEKYPQDFTVERMKKKRGNKLYIDYVQHWQGKTIICPYSTRGKEGAPVAAPLYWEEINEELRPNKYNVFEMIERIKKIGCPFEDYYEQKNENLIAVVEKLKVTRG